MSIKTLTLDFCEIEFYQDYVVCTVNEGVEFGLEETSDIAVLAHEFYQGKPHVYLTNRVNRYSVNPNVYRLSSTLDTLIAFGVITKIYHAKMSAELEKNFYDKKFEIFEDLEVAKAWATDMVVKHKATIDK